MSWLVIIFFVIHTIDLHKKKKKKSPERNLATCGSVILWQKWSLYGIAAQQNPWTHL